MSEKQQPRSKSQQPRGLSSFRPVRHASYRAAVKTPNAPAADYLAAHRPEKNPVLTKSHLRHSHVKSLPDAVMDFPQPWPVILPSLQIPSCYSLSHHSYSLIDRVPTSLLGILTNGHLERYKQSKTPPSHQPTNPPGLKALARGLSIGRAFFLQLQNKARNRAKWPRGPGTVCSHQSNVQHHPISGFLHCPPQSQWEEPAIRSSYSLACQQSTMLELPPPHVPPGPAPHEPVDREIEKCHAGT